MILALVLTTPATAEPFRLKILTFNIRHDVGLADTVHTGTLDTKTILTEPFSHQHNQDAIKPLDSRPIRQFFGYAVY